MKFRKLALLLGIAPFVLGAIFFAACGGGDDDDDGGGGGGGGTGSDEQFVKGLCDAFADFEKDLTKVMSDPKNLSSEEDGAKAMAEPFGDLAKAFGDLKPPKDLKDWHKEASEQLDKAAKQLKDGNLDEGIFAEDSPIEEPPKAAQDRLEKLIKDDKNCSDFSFSGE